MYVVDLTAKRGAWSSDGQTLNSTLRRPSLTSMRATPPPPPDITPGGSGLVLPQLVRPAVRPAVEPHSSKRTDLPRLHSASPPLWAYPPPTHSRVCMYCIVQSRIASDVLDACDSLLILLVDMRLCKACLRYGVDLLRISV
jgi:hypothetical protein